jgi:hypothetical protein
MTAPARAEPARVGVNFPYDVRSAPATLPFLLRRLLDDFDAGLGGMGSIEGVSVTA